MKTTLTPPPNAEELKLMWQSVHSGYSFEEAERLLTEFRAMYGQPEAEQPKSEGVTIEDYNALHTKFSQLYIENARLREAITEVLDTISLPGVTNINWAKNRLTEALKGGKP